MSTTANPPLPDQPVGVPYPTRDWPTGPSPAGVDVLLDEAFDPTGPLTETRAVIAVHGGRIVAERYGGATDAWGAPGEPVGADTPLLSWSMAKSMLHALVGTVVLDGLVDLDDPLGVPSWPGADPRAEITFRHGLHMRDGLAFVEDYDPATGASDVIEMLFGSGRDDVAAYVEARPLAHHPGEVFNYSSGTSNLLSAAIGRRLGGDDTVSRRLHQRLFEPLGMSTAEPRFDTAGTWVASSYVYATARDMARFGLLYLRDGCWDGQRLLPAGWVDEARTWQATDAEDGLGYGSHWWVVGDEFGSFWASGYEGQMITVVPALDLVTVRLGKSTLDQKADLRAFRDRLTALFA